MWKINDIEWIDFELTSFCNIKCNGCWRETNESAPRVLNKDILPYELIVERFKKEDFPSMRIINFCGSVDEPCTHPDFFKIIDYFKTWNCHINVATNGSLRTTKWWTQLGKKLKDTTHAITFGIDGLEDTHHIYREGSNYKKVINNAKAFMDAGGIANWQFIEFEHNRHQLEVAEQLSVELGFSKFKIIRSTRNTYKDPNKIINTDRTEKTTQSVIKCKYGHQERIFVNHMGMLVPCCYVNGPTMRYIADRNTRSDYRRLLDECQGELGISLYYNSVEEVIEGDLWTSIIDKWETDNPLPECAQKCKHNIRDEFENRYNPNKYDMEKVKNNVCK